MSHSYAMQPVTRPVVGSIRPPGSKSLTNRALVLAALAEGTTTLRGVLDSVDTQVMIESLRRLGLLIVRHLELRTIELFGCGGTISPTGTCLALTPVPAREESTPGTELWLENSGTSIRFLTAICCLGQGRFRLDGNTRMRERPIAPLVEALRSAGVDLRCELGTDCPPVVIEAHGLPGGIWTVNGNLSSQYLSALLMTAPCAQSDVTLSVRGELVSRPYVDMTIANMRQFGAEVSEPRPNVFQITARPYRGCLYDIEPDASAASYFFALAAVTGGDITVEGLTRGALQGDVAFVEALVQMGCRAEYGPTSIRVIGGPLRGIDIDMNAISDTAQTLACVAPFAVGPTRIRNVAHMRLKETDRVAAVVTELRRLGLTVDEHPDGMTIHPGTLHGGTVATYDDHRMAMSFALLGLRQPGIMIADPGCTAKTYPEYFTDLETLCQAAR
ncbi:MAG: 3-phosphoshikimate 1-carboxyvinyltransferase [Planctomycetota bacterium]|nr:MAG: 3-phosphoshikimate 1-carboxyvinyltransferase [Planctomycetota bacterium]